MQGRTRCVGVAVVAPDATVWTSALPPGTAAQKDELIAFTQALKPPKSKTANIYMDRRYAFSTAHVHGLIYKERELLMVGEKPIKNKNRFWSY